MVDIVPRLKTPRVESRKHLDWIKTLPCTWPRCCNQNIDPHHLRFVGPEEPAGMGITSSDKAWAAATGVDLRRRCDHLWSIGPERVRL